MDIQKIRILLGLSADRPLSPEEKRRRTRYIVYPAMCLLFAGSLWLIYSPSEKERAAEEKEKGFNTDIPSPGQQRMDGNKVDAYEREELEKKDKYRKNAFQEMASLFGSSGKDTVHLPEGMAELPVEEADNPSTGSHNTVRSSAGAYRNMNRTLDNFYTRAENSERNELLRRIEELEHERQMKKPSQETTMEEKMALMEKSYELAARYNGKQATTTSPAMDKRQRTAVKPVKQVRHQVVSSLSQPASNGESGNGFAGERNVGFNTPAGKVLTSDRNTIPACVHGTQTVSDGQALRIRLLEPMVVDDRFIPKGTILTGGARMEGERLDVLVQAVEYKGTVIPVELEVYDADGQRGIPVPDSMEYDAAREIAANMGTSMNGSINISTDAGAQIASDLGKGVIQGVSGYVAKKMRTVKVTLKAGHRLLLHSPEQ